MNRRPAMTEEEREQRLTQPWGVYVPAEGTHLTNTLAPASGIVGEPTGDRITVYYEGNVHGAVNLKTFADKVECAMGRLATRYPTSSVRSVKEEELLRVGTFDPIMGRIAVTDPKALASWLGSEKIEATELLTSESKSARRREMQGHLQSDQTNPAIRKLIEKEAKKLGL